MEDLTVTFVKVSEPKLNDDGSVKSTKSIMFRGEKVIVHNDDLDVDIEKTKFFCVSVCASNDSKKIIEKFTAIDADGKVVNKQHTFKGELYEESVLSATMSMLNPK